MTKYVHNIYLLLFRTFQIKGLVNIDQDDKRSSDPCRGDDNSDRNHDHDPPLDPTPLLPSSSSATNGHHNPHTSLSPPLKRSRISPVDSILRDSAWKDHGPVGDSDPRDYRVEPRDLSRDSSRDWMKDFNRDSSRENGRDYSNPRDNGSRDPSRDRDLERDISRELLKRDHESREIARTIASHTFPHIPVNSSSSAGSRRHTPSPVVNSSSSPSGRSLVPSSSYYSRPSQYEPSLLPPRSSPKSPPGPENKLTSQLG